MHLAIGVVGRHVGGPVSRPGRRPRRTNPWVTTVRLTGGPGSWAGERAKLARTLPSRHEVQGQLHEFPGHRHGFFRVAQLEDRVTSDDFLGLHEGAINDAELAVLEADLRASGNRHQAAIVEHAARLDLAVGKFMHGVHHFRRRRYGGTGVFDDVHKTHLRAPSRGEPPASCAAELSRYPG